MGILRTLDLEPEVEGRELARRLRVHEATVSRDLAFIAKVRAEYERSTGARMHARSFRFIRGGGYETVFEIRHGARVR